MLRIAIFLSGWIRVVMILMRPGGAKAIVAENIALRQQLIMLSRQRHRSPKLNTFDRLLFGFLAGIINPKRLHKIDILLKPATIIKFHKALVRRKYHLLYTRKSPKKPGPKEPSDELIKLILELKERNPKFGYLRIAMQIKEAFGIDLDEGLVRRVLGKHYKNRPRSDDPSWLTFIGHAKDSLWSVDLFRVESIHLKSHWVMVVLDQYTRRIIGFATHKGDVNGIDLCCMFNKIISQKNLPRYLSSDNDLLFIFHRWRANLNILNIEEIKSIPYAPMSHPFVERVIGTVRREFVDQTFFWNANDLQSKLDQFQKYYNHRRSHSSLNKLPPNEKANEKVSKVVSIDEYRWKTFSRGLFQLPIAA